MAKFKIGVYEECGGYVEIEAENEGAAREKAQEILDAEGVEGFAIYDQTYRNCTILDCAEDL